MFSLNHGITAKGKAKEVEMGFLLHFVVFVECVAIFSWAQDLLRLW